MQANRQRHSGRRVIKGIATHWPLKVTQDVRYSYLEAVADSVAIQQFDALFSKSQAVHVIRTDFTRFDYCDLTCSGDQHFLPDAMSEELL